MLTDTVRVRVQKVEGMLGVQMAACAELAACPGPSIAAVLVPAARVCFTGTIHDSAGRPVSKDDLERIAQEAGLTPVKSVTIKKCEVLITAEIGSQSDKSRRAQELGKPVFSVDEFFAWIAQNRHR